VATTAYTLTRPLVGRIATKHVTISTCSLLQTIQLGVGIPQGCGAVVHACREYTLVCNTDNTVDRALVKVDMRKLGEKFRYLYVTPCADKVDILEMRSVVSDDA